MKKRSLEKLVYNLYSLGKRSKFYIEIAFYGCDYKNKVHIPQKIYYLLYKRDAQGK